jgi:hypothetical protein
MTNETKVQDSTMICGLSITQRDLLQQKLRELPETPPPRAVWQRIEAQAKAEGLFAGRRFGEPMKWITGAAIAAAVALFALRLPLAPEAEAPINGSQPSRRTRRQQASLQASINCAR